RTRWERGLHAAGGAVHVRDDASAVRSAASRRAGYALDWGCSEAGSQQRMARRSDLMQTHYPMAPTAEMLSPALPPVGAETRIADVRYQPIVECPTCHTRHVIPFQSGQMGRVGFVANFDQEVMRGQLPLAVEGIRRPGNRTIRPQ